MYNSKYQVRFDAIPMNDRPGKELYGYIYDPATKKQKKWNTHERSKSKAIRKVKERIEQIYGSGETIEDHTRQYDPTKIKSVLERYLKEYYIPIKITDKPPHKQKKLITTQKSQNKHLFQHLGDKSVLYLDKDDIDIYIKNRKEEGAANGTINREIQSLKAAINRKVKNGKSTVIMSNIKGHAKLKGNIKNGIISLEDFERFVEELPEYMKLIIKINHFTGARPGEIRELKWSQVDFKQCRLNFDWDETKEGYDKSIKLSDELTIELQTLYKMADKDDSNVPICEFCFQGPYRKNKLISERTYYKAWNDTCERLGQPFIKLDKIKKNGRPEATFTPHDLRRTRITMGINAGENPKAIMKQTGHKTMQVFQRYNIVDNTDQDELVKRQIENDEKLRVKEQEIQQEYDERTNKAIEKLESILWSVDDEQRTVLSSVMDELKKKENEVHKELDELLDI